MAVTTPVTDNLSLTCVTCGRSDPMADGLEGWGGLPQEESSVHPLCPDCVGDDPRVVSLAGMRPVDTSAPGTPLSGAFVPVREGDDLKHFVATLPFGQLWFECEKGIAFALQEKLPQSFPVTIEDANGGPFTVHISHHPTGAVQLTAPATTVPDTAPLDVYQTHRLLKMGFRATDDGRWSITLTPEENTPRNIARIIVHLGMFVYHLHPQWIGEVTVG